MATNGEEVEVIVFDLNGTFYNKHSKDEFYKFICTKRPQRVRFYFEMVYYELLKKFNQIRQTEFKENFFNYLDELPPDKVEEYAKEFWEKEYPENFNEELHAHFDKMKKEGKQIFCATGALELYVKPLFDLYPVDGYAGTKTHYQDETYLVDGKACKDEEKIKRIDEHFKGKKYTIVEAYSDSKETILEKAKKAYLVKDGELKPFKP